VTTYISAETARSLAKLVMTCFCVMMLVLVYVLWQSYEGRVDLVNSQRAGCERGKLDRADSAKGWRAAQDLALSNSQPWAARTYALIASNLETRSRIDCAKAFPKASLIP
jgi:hypothetical protein